jgi:hypothetical protein
MIEFNRKPSLLHISPSQLSCHPAASKAETFNDFIKHQIKDSLIPNEIKEVIGLFSLPLLVEVEIEKEKKYQYITGWNTINLNNKLNLKTKQKKIYALLIKDQLNSYQVQKYAWAYIFSTQLNVWHYDNNITNLIKFMERSPVNMYRKFNSHISEMTATKISSAKTLIEELAQTTRGVIRGQTKKNKNEQLDLFR